MVLVACACGGGDDEPKVGSPATATTSTRDATSSTTVPTSTTTPGPTTTASTAPATASTYEGTGDQVIEITKPRSGPAIVVLSYDGSSRFVVRGLDAERAPTDGLVDTNGGYRGSRPLDVGGNTTKYLDVTAGGVWRIEVQPLTMARHFDADATGRGDEFVFYAGDPGSAHWTHDGRSRFVVRTYTGTGGNDLIDATGPYDSTVPMDGPGYIEIVADGAWTVAMT